MNRSELFISKIANLIRTEKNITEKSVIITAMIQFLQEQMNLSNGEATIIAVKAYEIA